jgi:hypothetical protein
MTLRTDDKLLLAVPPTGRIIVTANEYSALLALYVTMSPRNIIKTLLCRQI